MTDKALDLFIKKLNDLESSPQGQIDLINTAIMNGWKSVYPSKRNVQKKQDFVQSDYSAELDEIMDLSMGGVK